MELLGLILRHKPNTELTKPFQFFKLSINLMNFLLTTFNLQHTVILIMKLRWTWTKVSYVKAVMAWMEATDNQVNKHLETNYKSRYWYHCVSMSVYVCFKEHVNCRPLTYMWMLPGQLLPCTISGEDAEPGPAGRPGTPGKIQQRFCCVIIFFSWLFARFKCDALIDSGECLYSKMKLYPWLKSHLSTPVRP